MKTAIIMVLCICLSPVSMSADKAGEAYRVGYIVGGHRMRAAMARQADEIRSEMAQRLGPRMIVFAGAAVAVTLFGPEVAEAARQRVRRVFRLSGRTELTLAWVCYLAISIGIIAYSLYEYGAFRSAPTAILLAGTVWPFIQILRGIRDDNRELRKSGAGRIKTLWFLCLVAALVWRLLAKGFGNIKIG